MWHLIKKYLRMIMEFWWRGVGKNGDIMLSIHHYFSEAFSCKYIHK